MCQSTLGVEETRVIVRDSTSRVHLGKAKNPFELSINLPRAFVLSAFDI